MGFLNKVEKAIDVSQTISRIAGKLDIQNIAGVNLNNLSVDSLGSIKNQIESKLVGQMTGLTTDLNSAINLGDLESQVTSMTNEIQNSVSLENLPSLSSNMDFGSFDMNNLLDFDPVNFM